MGETSTESKVNTRTEPEGSTQYDTTGLEQSEIDDAIAEEKEFHSKHKMVIIQIVKLLLRQMQKERS